MSRGNVEMLELLMEGNAQVDSQNHSGRTALHIAVLNQWLDCVAPLMNKNADANIQVILFFFYKFKMIF